MKRATGRKMKRALQVVAVATVLAVTLDCRTTPPFENVNPINKSGGSSGGGKSSSGTPNNVAPGFDKNTLLASFADCAVARYKAFEATAADFDAAAQAWGNQPGDDGLRTSARTAWGKAMDAWQEAELFTFGPAAVSTNPGGKDLRDSIYAWPLFNRCKVDETTVDGSFATPAFATALVSSRGLQTFEYLAFYEGTDNACSQFSVINSSGSWSAIAPTDLRAKKARYAAAASADVRKQASALFEAWDPARGNFRDELAKAGKGSKTFAADQDALNAVNEALFYIELKVKDLKLSRPLGLSECGAPDCATTAESIFSRRSKENLAHNFAGFRALFEGCGAQNAGLGFDDWLIAAGAGDLSTRILAALAAAETALDAVQPSFEDALASSPAKVKALYDALKSLTDLLKTELVSVLNLELPKSSEGDND